MRAHLKILPKSFSMKRQSELRLVLEWWDHLPMEIISVLRKSMGTVIDDPAYASATLDIKELIAQSVHQRILKLVSYVIQRRRAQMTAMVLGCVTIGLEHAIVFLIVSVKIVERYSVNLSMICAKHVQLLSA